MAFNNMNSGLSGRYARPMQLLQQIDFSALPMSSYSDLANLMDVSNAPQSSTSSHHIPPPVEQIVTNDSNRSMTGDYSSGRPASDFCMPTISTIANTTSVQGLSGQFNQHFHHFPNQVLLPDSSYQHSSNKIPNFTKSWYNNNQQNRDRSSFTNEAAAPEPEDGSVKPRRGRKPSKNKKEKKEKIKRVRYIKPGCSEFCRRRCKQKISQSAREDLFNKYWNLEDDSKKKQFVAENAIKMPMMKCKEGSRRSFSVDWAFTINGESFSVCKLFFLHTLDIPENAAYAAIKGNKFFNSDTPIIKGKAQEKAKPTKSVWFETDLDDYSSSQKKAKSSTAARSESFSKIEKFLEMRPGCTNVCRRNCQSKFTYEERLALFNEYRSLSNIRKQRDYISKFIHRMERKRVRAGENTRRGCSIQWVLPVKGKEIPVCKTFFLHTIGISERAAYNIGLQNEIEPVERVVKRPRQKSQTICGKHLSFGSIIAKGKLKSALKLSRKKKKKIESEPSDTEEDDADDDHYFDSWKETRKKKTKVKTKVAKKRGRKRKKPLDKTVTYKKVKMIEDVHEEESSENEFGKTKSDSSIKISSTLFNLPIKKRGNLKQKVPSLKMKFTLCGKKRNPYKRKETPSKTNYPMCPETCRKHCRENMSEEARKHIFDEFWSLENMEEQRKYIANCVKRIAKPTCACLVASHLRGKRRGYSISWCLNFRGLEVPVCKTFFMHVLQVSDSVVYKAVREDESFIADFTPQPCKHFTGLYQIPKVPALPRSQEKKTNDHCDGKKQILKNPIYPLVN